MRQFKLLTTAAGFALAAGVALAQPPAAPAGPAATPAAPAAPVIGPNPNPAHPIGGYLPAPAGSTRRIERDWLDAVGLPLYTMNRECRGQCAAMFPPLTPPEKAAPPSRDWTVRIRDENGDPQWVYKGQPVYTFFRDTKDQNPMADSVYPGIVLARP